MKPWGFGKVVLSVFIGTFLAIAAVCSGLYFWQTKGVEEATKKTEAELKRVNDKNDKALDKLFPTTQPVGR